MIYPVERRLSGRINAETVDLPPETPSSILRPL